MERSPKQIYALTAVGFAVVTVLLIALLSSGDVNRSAIFIDVSTHPTRDLIPRLTDAEGTVIAATWDSGAPCEGLCPSIPEWWRYEWSPHDLDKHPQPYTVNLVLHGEEVASAQVETWQGCTGYQTPDHAITVRCNMSLSSTWYQTEMGRALLTALAFLILVKFLLCLICGVTKFATWVKLAVFNAVVLPVTWYFAYTHAGYLIAFPLMVLTMVWDAVFIRQTAKYRNTPIVVGIEILMNFAAILIGLTWQLSGWSITY